MDNWDRYVAIQETGTKDEIVKHLSNAKTALEKLDPYQPIGVDPALAEAVKDFKLAALAQVEYTIDVIKGSTHNNVGRRPATPPDHFALL